MNHRLFHRPLAEVDAEPWPGDVLTVSEDSDSGLFGETLVPQSSAAGDVDDVEVCLTVIYHPSLDRIGERIALSRSAVELSRTSPEFAQVGSDVAAPLADRYVSRKPVTLALSWPDGVRIDPGAASGVTINGEALTSAKRFGLAELRTGVTIELAKRIVLLLHAVARYDGADTYGLVGHSDAIRRVCRQISHVADLSVPVLIRGETGVGKERVARAIHDASTRSDNPCVTVNMGAVTPSTAVSELFGHARGAFTSAIARHTGVFERADGGTLFLDEIGEAPDNVQPMLLRVLENGTFTPIGDTAERTVDVRVIAATDADLEASGREGSFRTALLHRLSGYEIVVPPLRERREDIPRLVAHFVRRELADLGATAPDADAKSTKLWFPTSLMARFIRCDWPGNVRQLRNAVRQLLISNRGARVLVVDDTVARILDGDGDEPTTGTEAATEATPTRRVEDLTDDELVDVLRAHKWAMGPAATSLGVARSSLYDRMERSKVIRVAKEIPDDEIRAARDAHGDDFDAMVDALRISKRALKNRLRDLGLA